jgi:hypothetical protein
MALHLRRERGYLHAKVEPEGGALEIRNDRPREPWLAEPHDRHVALKCGVGYLGGVTDADPDSIASLRLVSECRDAALWSVERDGNGDIRLRNQETPTEGAREAHAGESSGQADCWKAEPVPLVTALVPGGLGNQMFMVATVLAAAWDRGGAAVFPRTHRRPQHHRHYWDSFFSGLTTMDPEIWSRQKWTAFHRGYRLPSLWQRVAMASAGVSLLALKRLGRLTRGWLDPKTRGLESRLRDRFRMPGVRALLSQYRFSKIPELAGGDSVLLEGLFQCSRYFERYRDRLCDVFRCPPADARAVEQRMRTLRQKYPGRPIVSLNVRGTDFRTMLQVSLGISVVLTWDNYYRAAVEQFAENSVFLVVTDDEDWCREMLTEHLACYEWVRGASEFEQLFTMAACDHNIVANSTFSYWGAFLNRRGGRTVAPRRWRDVNRELDRFPPDVAEAADGVAENICLKDWILVWGA